ncbi:MAG: histidinol-phosphate transaminase [Acidiferrobacterales bacterium]
MSRAPRLIELAVPGVRGLEPYQPGKPIEELEREYGVQGAIKLASNENPLGPSPRALEALARALPGIARYPDGAGFALKSAIARHHGVGPECVTLGNGSNDILELAARSFAGAGDEVVFSEHAFAVYPIVTQAVGARAVVVPARHWGHDLDAMLRAVTDRTKLVFIANPNNPTGTWLERRALARFLKEIPDRVIVVLDEAYFEYVEQPDYPNGIGWISEHPNLVVARTFSKAYGLAGLRVGFGVSGAALADLLNRVRQPFNVNSLAQAGALAALEDSDHLERSRRINREGMRQLTEGFRRLGLDFIESVGNFVSVALPLPGREVYERLLRQGVIVRPVDNYGMPRHVRVTVGLPQENQRFLEALAQAIGADR